MIVGLQYICYSLYVDLLSSHMYHVKWRITNMDIIRIFGTNVKHYRQQIGLSQEAFAEKCGMHRTYISAIECFRRSISLENIQRIAEALNVEPYQLFLENKESTENDK